MNEDWGECSWTARDLRPPLPIDTATAGYISGLSECQIRALEHPGATVARWETEARAEVADAIELEAAAKRAARQHPLAVAASILVLFTAGLYVAGVRPLPGAAFAPVTVTSGHKAPRRSQHPPALRRKSRLEVGILRNPPSVFVDPRSRLTKPGTHAACVAHAGAWRCVVSRNSLSVTMTK